MPDFKRIDTQLVLLSAAAQRDDRAVEFRSSPTWLYAAKVETPELDWSAGWQRIHPVALARHRYAKARRIGMTAMVGGKNKTRIRNDTPHEFRDFLLSIARTAAVASDWRD